MIPLAGVLLVAAKIADGDVCFNHSPSGVEFGPAPAGMRCGTPTMLDPQRGDSSISYKSDRSERHLTATAFVYRRLPPLSAPDEPAGDQLERVRAEILEKYKDLSCEAWSPKSQPRMIGLRCVGHSSEVGPQEVVTFVGLEEVGQWWLKIRATAPVAERAASEEDLESLLANVKRGPDAARK